MRVYHRTRRADAIQREGFRDGYYILPPPIGDRRGVFVSTDWPLDVDAGPDRDRVLTLDITESLWDDHAHSGGETDRERVIPAARLDRFRDSLRVLSQDEETDLIRQRWG